MPATKREETFLYRSSLFSEYPYVCVLSYVCVCILYCFRKINTFSFICFYDSEHSIVGRYENRNVHMVMERLLSNREGYETITRISKAMFKDIPNGSTVTVYIVPRFLILRGNSDNHSLYERYARWSTAAHQNRISRGNQSTMVNASFGRLTRGVVTKP